MKDDMAGEQMNIDVSGASTLKSHSNLKHYGSSSSRFSIEEAVPSASVVAIEGRVHGGSLVAMLMGGLTHGPGSSESPSREPSDIEKSNYLMMSKRCL